jgi:3-dehydroquinate synthase
MTILTVASDRGPYDLVVEHGALDRLAELCSARGVPRPAALVTDTTVGPLHARRTAAASGCPPPFELPDGEVHKRWPAVERVCVAWLDAGVHRTSTVAAVGGGVVTDTVGFAAAVYLRGVDWIAAPTTLLAMVDAAIGGKTGVNLEQGKNLVGAFWPPRLVVADPAALATLGSRELRAGLVEVVKGAWIDDRSLLDLVDRPIVEASDLPPSAWEEVVARAAAVKARIVSSDEREGGRRKALNLGHTVGHALEAATGYERFLHGEAVAWGLIAEARLARRHGLLDADSTDRLERAAARLGPLPPVADLDPERVVAALARDKKRDDLGVAWVLPTDHGVTLDARVDADDVREVLADVAARPPVGLG